MLIPFFFKLRDAGVPVSITEFLTLLEALEARLANASAEDFYFLARSCLVKDERHFDRFDRAFAAHFKGAEELFESMLAQIPEEWLKRMGISDDGVRLRAPRALPPAFERALEC